MKVLVLTWEYPPRSVGGIAPHVEQLSKAEVKLGAEVHVITCSAPETASYQNDEGVHVHRVEMNNPNPSDFLSWVLQLNINLMERAVSTIHQYGSFDLIHAHDWLVAYSAKALKHSNRIPIVATIHATEWGRNNGLHNDLQRYISDVEWWLGYEAWRVICCSDYMCDELMKVFQIPRDKINVLPNGVSLKEFEFSEGVDKVRSRYASPNEKLVFFIGRLVHEKGVHILLEAWPKVLRYFPKAKLVIAGKGPSDSYLKARARDLGVYDRVYFTGYIDDRVRNSLYKAANVAVVPSLYEPFGITALEAMAARVPVIVADTGGLDSIIKHEINGWKFYTGNSNSLADSILHLLHRPDVAERLRRNAIQDIENIYNWDKIAKGTLEVYRAVLDEAEGSEWRPEHQMMFSDAVPHKASYKIFTEEMVSRYHATH